MSKIKYLVTGIDNQTLGGLVGTLIKGEIDGEAELICCQGFPQAYKISDRGQVVELPFGTLLTELIREEKLARVKLEAGEKLVQNIVRLESKGRPEIA